MTNLVPPHWMEHDVQFQPAINELFNSWLDILSS